MLIRRVRPADRRAIFGVHNAAFASNDGSPGFEATLVYELGAAGDTIAALSLVAELDGNVVGHVLGSRARIDEHPSLGLGPLAVLPGYQKQGVGSALMHAVLAAADALSFAEAVLLGDPGYYQRFGFQPAKPLGVIPPNPQWAQHFQIRTLSAWNAERTGNFHYAKAFGID